MNHTVGTVASGAFIMAPRGKSGLVIAGYAIGNQLIAGSCADITRVEPTEEALANALLWAGSHDLLDALNYLLEKTVDRYLAQGIEPDQCEKDARNKALAAIKKATVAMQVAA